MEVQMRQTKMRKRFPGWLKLVITVILTLAVTVGTLCLLLGRSGLALVEGWLLARYAFVDTEADLGEAADQAISGLVTGLGDRWSYYMDEEGYRATVERRANNYVGVGVTVMLHEEGLSVQKVTHDGPAEKAGVRPGDLIVAVDGTSLAGMTMDEASGLIQGEEGTTVELSLKSQDEVREVTCTRTRLVTPSAARTMLDGNIGYIQLSNFYSNSADSLRQEVEAVIEEGAKSLILDVRNNPGGYTSELKSMLDFLLPAGPVFTEKARWGRPEVYESDEACIDLPMVVLVNANSYSAAELFAAQLRESAQVPIVGEVTSGKGYYQITYMLPNGGGIGLSTGTYCTGSGHSLIGEGIEPDVELTDPNEQLQTAIDLLMK